MTDAIGFWHMSYEKGWFVRMSIVDKLVKSIIGTVELCVRISEDEFNNMGILRVDVRSDYKQEEILYNIFGLVTPKMEGMLGCKSVFTWILNPALSNQYLRLLADMFGMKKQTKL